MSPAVRRVVVAIVAVVAVLIGVCVLVVIGTIAFFYLHGGMWPGTHGNPGHMLH